MLSQGCKNIVKMSYHVTTRLYLMTMLTQGCKNIVMKSYNAIAWLS